MYGHFGQSNMHSIFDFGSRPARKDSNVPQLKSSLELTVLLYIVPCKDSGMPAFVGPFGLAGVLPGGPPVKNNKCFYLTNFL